MRRMWAASAATLVCLALGAVPVMAQEVSEAPAASTAIGAVHVTGRDGYPALVTAYASESVGDVTQLRGGVITMPSTMDDPRVSGQATFAFSVDVSGDAGTEWGTFRLENEGGTWEGPCGGAVWDDGNAAIGSCWLTGSGDYDGYTYYRQHLWGSEVGVQGVIVPGVPPTDFPELPAPASE